ncbi:hypothetical protein ACQ4PT_049963 [Festuca glaucescens]
MGSGTGADERSNGVSGKELDTSGGDTYRCDDGEQSRLLPPKKRPRGPGDLLLHRRVDFVGSSAAAGPSNYRYPRHEHSLYKYNRSVMSSFPAPNARVANMMRRMNYEPGSGLGKYGQGIVSPIKDFERGDADGSRKQGREFCEEILAKVHQQWEAALARQDDQETLELVTKATIIEAVAVIHEKSTTGELAAGDLIWEFTWLKERFPEAYKMHRLADATGVVVAPLVRPMLRKWQPLLDPTLWLDVAAMLKNTMDDGSATSPYAALINDTVVPAVKVSGWKPTDPEGMLRFLEPWEDILPPSTMQRILEEVVMPELTAIVDSWDRRSSWDPTCCHPQLCPWVRLAGPLLEGLYATVRRKLQEGLQGWDTGSALASNYEGVSPWKALFRPATWEELIDEIGVLPRLAQALLELRITAPRQNDESFEIREGDHEVGAASAPG